ncbi:hypothetical protein OOT46_19855 [Aquabacterium sp. A7-Y]|uniref:hypothetical protein n=1 Tax=Aquabacterium sp. A7-Y TaxID=1349605 RepID=UPI00223E282F|nr:hypothetical protein [Aquabacterium sp. A7-Y]MCW7540094.1 hypothetical protein [Aquabacterium sp. A7-Y]
MSSEETTAGPVSQPAWRGPARRVMLGWDGEGWRVVREQRVPLMTLPPSDPLPDGPQAGAQGSFCIEARDAGDGLYYRRLMADPLAAVPSPWPPGPAPGHAPQPRPEVLLEVLIPDLPEISELHLVSLPGDAATGTPRTSRAVLKLLRTGTSGGGGGTGGTGQSSHASGEPH